MSSMAGRKAGSEVFAGSVGVLLISLAAGVMFFDVDPRCWSFKWISGLASLMFGLVLMIWVFGKGKIGIGNPTVNMVAAITAATIAIFSFANDLTGNSPVDKPKCSATAIIAPQPPTK